MTEASHQHDAAAEMRALPDEERQRLIIYGVLMEQVVDARHRFAIKRMRISDEDCA